MSITIDAAVLLGVLAPLLGALAVLALDVLWPGRQRLHYLVAFVALIIGVAGVAGGLGLDPGSSQQTLCFGSGSLPTCLYSVNPASATLQLVALVAAGLTLLLAWPGERRVPAERTSVTVALVLTATGGAVGVAGAHDIASWIVALELATVPVIVLVALPATKAALSGAVQLLVTSLVSVGLVAIGAATWYIATGSPVLDGDAALASAASGPHRALLSLSVFFFLAGIGFKLSLAPFHAWTPTTYTGASLPVAAFLSGVSKVAALAAFVVIVQAVSSLGAAGVATVGVLAVLSMTLGNLVAYHQRDVVRLLAWSTIAQAGWVILPLVSPSQAATRASIVYLSAYVVATLLAFTVITAVVARLEQGGSPGAGRTIESYAGLLRSSPLLGGALALALTSLAGLPPGLLGLVAKIGALQPVLARGWWVLALFAGANVVLGVAVYFRWFKVLFADGSATEPAEPVRTHPSVAVALSVGTVLLAVLSVLPALLTNLLG